jgi:hypothetical protein
MQLEAKTAGGDVKLVMSIAAVDGIAIEAGYRLYDVTTNPAGVEIPPDNPDHKSFTIKQHPAMMGLVLSTMPVFANATEADVFITATQDGQPLADSDTGNPGARHHLLHIQKAGPNGTVYGSNFYIHFA